MYPVRFRLFDLLGFPIELDASWFVIAVLWSWTLASGFFPAQYQDLSKTTYCIMGALGAFELFASVVLHEIGHAVVARRFRWTVGACCARSCGPGRTTCAGPRRSRRPSAPDSVSR